MKNVEDIYPLSPVQAGMLFHTIQEPGSGVYFEQYACTVVGTLDADALARAWQVLVERHPVLRTAFIWEGIDRPVQVVRRQATLPFAHQDWQTLSARTQQERFERLLQEDRQKGFDLARAPVGRVQLIMLTPEQHRMLWSFHHLILDGWSLSLLLKELFVLYNAAGQHRPPSLPQRRPYRDYIAWLQQQDLTAAEQFWQGELAGVTAPTTLAVRQYRARQEKEEYGEQTRLVAPETLAALEELARAQRLTLNTLIQGAWTLLLSRYSGDADLLYGAAVSGRPPQLADVEQMIGMFINTLPVRVRVPPDEPLLSWLQRLQETQLASRQYEYSPLTRIQQWSDVPNGTPFFESIFVFENYPHDGAAILDGESSLEIRDVRYKEWSNYPLALLAVPRQPFTLHIIYDRTLFTDATGARMLEQLETLLENMVRHPEQALSSLSMLPPAERKLLLESWNNTEIAYRRSRGIHYLIEEQVQRTPEATAVVWKGNHLRYAELDRRAELLGRYLRSLGVGPDVPVGLCLERSPTMIIAILGVLKAGGAYLPLDPDYPADRLSFMLEDAECRVLLTEEKLLNRLPSAGGHKVVCLDSDWDEITTAKQTEATVDAPSPSPQSLAYIIYTSGSTGRPKGVLITHDNLVHSTTARFHYYREPVSTFLLLSSFAFDSSVAGIFWTLCQGGTLVLPQQKQEQDMGKLASLIEQYQVTHTLCLPTLYNLLLAYAPGRRMTSLQTVIIAGEACPPDLARRHYETIPQATLYNEYGPTEGTVWCTVYRVPRHQPVARVPIGKPISNMQAFVLDEQRRLVPSGVPGELYIAGAGLAAGYLNRPELTAERFIWHSLEQALTRRLYRTGDRALYTPEGQLLFLGRVDDQVKLRGYRIELGEIESILLEHDGIESAAVLLSATPPRLSTPAGDNLLALATQATAHGLDIHALLDEVEQLTEEEVAHALARAGRGPG